MEDSFNIGSKNNGSAALQLVSSIHDKQPLEDSKSVKPSKKLKAWKVVSACLIVSIFELYFHNFENELIVFLNFFHLEHKA